jgi:hypothetical protein
MALLIEEDLSGEVSILAIGKASRYDIETRTGTPERYFILPSTISITR